jgi:hypothetical protein
MEGCARARDHSTGRSPVVNCAIAIPASPEASDDTGNRSSWPIVCTGVTGSHGPRRRADVEYDDSRASLSLVTDTGLDVDEALGLLHARSYARLVRLAVVLGNDEGRAEELV